MRWVVFGLPSVPCRAAPDLTDASCRALCEQAGLGHVDDYQRDHHSRWLDQLCQAFGALGRFAFWVALIWFGTCGKAAAPSIESDLFNPSIPRVRRTKDGGFDAVVPRGSIVADRLTGDGSDAKSPREQRHLASH